MTDAPARHIPPPDFLAEPGLAAVLAALPRARLVGGCVRDTLAGRKALDIDLATPDPPDAVTAALQADGLRAVPTGLDHGTVTAVAHHRGFEVTTLRRDVSTDGRHARVAFTDDWRADAARRDFTINALSMTREGAVYDYFGGIADLEARRLRFVGDPATRIAEDYLRILRYFRFHARFARGAPDAEAATALTAGIPGLAQLSVERIWSELKRILVVPDPAAALSLMRDLHVLQAILPEAGGLERLAAMVAAGAPADPILRLAALLPADAPPLARRLRLSTAEADRLVALQTAPTPGPGGDDATLRRLLADYPADLLIGRNWLSCPDAALRHRLTAMPRPVFPLKGRDIPMPPGPAMGEALQSLRAWWLATGCTATRAELLGRLRGPAGPE